MNFVRMLPVLLSCILLGAHFSRAGLPLPMWFCVGLVFLLAVPRSWVARVAQFTLAVGTLEWVRTLVSLSRLRHALGEPWQRAALIIGGVVVFTAVSLLVFRNPSIRRRYGLDAAETETID